MEMNYPESHQEIRCQYCKVLLAKRNESIVSAQRNGLEVHCSCQELVVLRCYRSGCRRMNIVKPSMATPPKSSET